MSFSSRTYVRPYSTGGLPSAIKGLIIANTAVFLLQFFFDSWIGELFTYFRLVPAAVINYFFVWQLGTYLFLHGDFLHLLFNMLTLWMFGRELEMTWGARRFLQFYFFCGVGAGILVVLASYIFGDTRATIGASGAIYGILLASAVLWPDRIVYFNFLFPIQMKWLVIIYGAIAFMGARNVNSGVSNVAHLSGMLFGYIFLKMPRVRGFDAMGSVKESYRKWKLARAKRKFQVYMRKQKSDKDNFVH